jgi:hypothetical protein
VPRLLCIKLIWLIAERSSTIRGEFLPELLKSGHPLNPFKGGAQTEEQVCVPLSGIPSSLSGNQLFSQFASLAATVGNDYSSTSESGHLPYMLRTLDIGVVSMCLKTIGIGSSFLVSAFLDHTFFPGTNRLVLKRRIPLTKCDHTEDKRIIASMMLELRVLTHTPVRKHENIVQLLGVGWETDALELQPRTGAALSESLRKWPVMLIERADKGTLAGFLRETATELPYRLKKTLCLDILLGLEVLHYCGIIHGDVKLTNVLMFSNPNAETREIRPYIAKLADFGGAVCDLKSPARLPSGTRPWNAPEWQQNIRPENAPNSDIYSLGFAILQVMVDGRNPFRDFHFDEVRTETYLKEGSALNSFEDDIDLWKKDDLKLLPYLKSLLSLKADINKTELALILDATIRVNPRERNLEGPKALLLAEEAQFR